MRAGELESMCQHVVCFSFESACRCSKGNCVLLQYIHTQRDRTNTHTILYGQYTQVNHGFVYMHLARGGFNFSDTDILDRHAYIAIQTKHTEQHYDERRDDEKAKIKWIDTRIHMHIMVYDIGFDSMRMDCFTMCEMQRNSFSVRDNIVY